VAAILERTDGFDLCRKRGTREKERERAQSRHRLEELRDFIRIGGPKDDPF
jgi:hypothetical protein